MPDVLTASIIEALIRQRLWISSRHISPMPPISCSRNITHSLRIAATAARVYGAVTAGELILPNQLLAVHANIREKGKSESCLWSFRNRDEAPRLASNRAVVAG